MKIGEFRLKIMPQATPPHWKNNSKYAFENLYTHYHENKKKTHLRECQWLKYFSKINLKDPYQQIVMNENDHSNWWDKLNDFSSKTAQITFYTYTTVNKPVYYTETVVDVANRVLSSRKAFLLKTSSRTLMSVLPTPHIHTHSFELYLRVYVNVHIDMYLYVRRGSARIQAVVSFHCTHIIYIISVQYSKTASVVMYNIRRRRALLLTSTTTHAFPSRTRGPRL